MFLLVFNTKMYNNLVKRLTKKRTIFGFFFHYFVEDCSLITLSQMGDNERNLEEANNTPDERHNSKPQITGNRNN